MGGPMGQPQAGPPSAAAGGPPGRLSSSNHLIGRILNLINPPPPPQPQPPQAPPQGMPGSQGGDPRAQIMQLLAMAQQGGGQPPMVGAAEGGDQAAWQRMQPRGMAAEMLEYPERPHLPPAFMPDYPEPSRFVPPADDGSYDKLRRIMELLQRGGGRPMGTPDMGAMPMRRGGYPLDYMPGMPGLPVRTPYAKGGDYVQPDGRGDGRSDHVPAVLSPGEFVMDAETVALAGNGDNNAGARRMEQLRQNIRRDKGKALAKGKFSPDAKPLESYLPKGGDKKPKRGRA